MIIEICPYFNDHQTACCLMIDDLLPIATTLNGKASACNDWGYLMDGEGSLYKYFEHYLLEKYPEIRGTIFLPLASHHYIPENHGYTILCREIDSTFVDFLQRIGSRFEMAFHGVKHSWQDSFNKTRYEFAEPDTNLEAIVSAIENFSKSFGITFTGGKFPGYQYRLPAIEFLAKGNFSWWALDIDMINRQSVRNKIVWNEKLRLTLIPTNISGDIFKNYFWLNPRLRILSLLLKPWKKTHPIDYLNYLYENRHPITIQEHFQNQTTNGTRQPMNVYDDLWSLDSIYGLLRGLDIWYASCGEIADYFFNYQHTSINKIDSLTFEITSTNPLKLLNISIKSSAPTLFDIARNKTIHGIKKQGLWIYNRLNIGQYRVI